MRFILREGNARCRPADRRWQCAQNGSGPRRAGCWKRGTTPGPGSPTAGRRRARPSSSLWKVSSPAASTAGEAAGLGDGSGDGCGPGMGADSARAQPVTQRARAASSAANLFRFILILSRFWSSFCPHCTLSPASAQQGLCGPAARAAINIHRPSRWFFICGHSPMFFATRRTRNTVCQLRGFVTCLP